jgi:cholesterol transport system auxiliary component
MINRYPAVHAAMLLGCVVFIAGCAGLQPPRAEEINVYVLDAALPAAPRTARNNLVLVVSAPRAQPGYDTPQMVYVSQQHELGFFARNRWADVPARMLAPLMVQALEDAAGFGTVVQAPTVVTGDLRLETELIRLQHEFLAKPSRARIVLRAQLIDVRERRVRATRQFEEMEAATTETPYGGVVAANRALERVLSQLAEFCASHATGAVPAQSATQPAR